MTFGLVNAGYIDNTSLELEAILQILPSLLAARDILQERHLCFNNRNSILLM